jgi:predicted cytidylate kinase
MQETKKDVASFFMLFSRHMQKRNIITICGFLGSGKSTAAKRVAAALDYPHFSGGDFMRKLAEVRGVSLAELGALAENDPEIDKEIDRMQKEFMDTHDNFVIDSRLGWYWAQDSFKVFLSLDSQTAAARVFADMHKNARHGEVAQVPESVDEVEARLLERLASERARYKEYYGIENHFDPSHFDLVIDTKENDIPAVERLIIEGYEAWKMR